MFLMFFAVGLVVVTVAIHAAGFSALIRTMMRSHALDRSGFRRVTLLVIGLACWLILLNLIEISVWALSYIWAGLPSGRRVGVLLCRRHLHLRWLRRPGVEQAVADACTAPGVDWPSDARALEGFVLRLRQPVDW
jgi:hypothetical protein